MRSLWPALLLVLSIACDEGAAGGGSSTSQPCTRDQDCGAAEACAPSGVCSPSSGSTARRDDGGTPVDTTSDGSGSSTDGAGSTSEPEAGPAPYYDGCEPLSCADRGASCGPIGDGCGGVLECGDCQAPDTCGGGGVASQCGRPDVTCTPQSCASLDAECGFITDGCGGIQDCGSCQNVEGTCGGAGVPHQCGVAEVSAVECPALLSCDDVGATCGLVGNGCGGTTFCGICNASEGTCGGGGVANRCGKPACEPRTCAEVDPAFCGVVPDGCGGTLTGCGATCSGEETCGGGGVADRCGVPTVACVPETAASVCAPGVCGPQSDGCGGTLQCGGCNEPETCGGGGTPSQCGAPSCVPYTCDDFGATCGIIADGCGDTLSCGACSDGQGCGAAGVPYTCGALPCVAKTEAQACAGDLCGPQSDGCGGTLSCGGCDAGESCGGGGVPSQCGSSCTPLTCDDQNATCGPVGDGCGGLINTCGNCESPSICGGGGVPSQCGGGYGGTAQDGGPGCTNLCEQQVYCPNGGATTVTGKVYAPNGTLPLPGVFVYVPNADLPAIPEGASCDRCTDEDLGEPLVSAVSANDGTFTLRHVPAGVSFPLVVKTGKWRRVVTVGPFENCSVNQLSAADTRLPKNRSEGNIPRFAIVTGRVDALECALRKAGVDDGEFGRPESTGTPALPTNAARVHLYRSNGAWADQALEQDCAGACGGTNLTTCCTNHDSSCGDEPAQCRQQLARTLYSARETLAYYDVVMFGCDHELNGRANRGKQWTANDYTNLRDYIDTGGRLFLSHYAYEWLRYDPDGSSNPVNGVNQADNYYRDILTFSEREGEGNLPDPAASLVDVSFPRGAAFNEWLGHVGAHYDAGVPIDQLRVVSIKEPRIPIGAVAAPARRWVYNTTANEGPGTGTPHKEDAVEHLTFNTPIGAADDQICGRALYTAFHVSNASTRAEWFPHHCSAEPLSAQEKILVWMFFDLAACVQNDTLEPPAPPSCTPRSCADVGAVCGQTADGCGGLLSCGSCDEGSICQQNQCVISGCTRTTCAEASANCGVIADGCGGTRSCGSCDEPETCGATTPNVCGLVCNPLSCESLSATCGAIGDGCGSSLDCGTCPPAEACGGGGQPNRCGEGTCVPLTCLDVGATCGLIGDGCGGSLDCGTCTAPQSCGAGGVPNQCGGTQCVPRTCATAGAECGPIGDGCGGSLQCGSCPSGQVCGALSPSQCDPAVCLPLTCASLGATCGRIGDGCGGSIECGSCSAPNSCGGGGVPNKCGNTSACDPLTCAELDAECGLVGTGCGGVSDCGSCPENTSCGGGGAPNQCGTSCVPLTCAEQNADCGDMADGCGGLLQCGSCTAPQLCGGGGVPNRCGVNFGG